MLGEDHVQYPLFFQQQSVTVCELRRLQLLEFWEMNSERGIGLVLFVWCLINLKTVSGQRFHVLCLQGDTPSLIKLLLMDDKSPGCKLRSGLDQCDPKTLATKLFLYFEDKVSHGHLMLMFYSHMSILLILNALCHKLLLVFSDIISKLIHLMVKIV